jgi:hypothetical protein
MSLNTALSTDRRSLNFLNEAITDSTSSSRASYSTMDKLSKTSKDFFINNKLVDTSHSLITPNHKYQFGKVLHSKIINEDIKHKFSNVYHDFFQIPKTKEPKPELSLFKNTVERIVINNKLSSLINNNNNNYANSKHNIDMFRNDCRQQLLHHKKENILKMLSPTPDEHNNSSSNNSKCSIKNYNYYNKERGLRRQVSVPSVINVNRMLNSNTFLMNDNVDLMQSRNCNFIGKDWSKVGCSGKSSSNNSKGMKINLMKGRTELINKTLHRSFSSVGNTPCRRNSFCFDNNGSNNNYNDGASTVKRRVNYTIL